MPSHEQVIERAMAFPMGPILERYGKEQGLSAELAREHEREIKRFLLVKALHPDRHYGMAGPIDELWHTFIIFTRQYIDFCNSIAGGYIHHAPVVVGEERPTDIYELFLRDYESTFKEVPPPHIWPRVSPFTVLGWITK